MDSRYPLKAHQRSCKIYVASMLWSNCIQMRRVFLQLFFCWLILLLYNEFVIYYATLLNCSWPNINPTGHSGRVKPLRAMILADPHLLGPYRGHPLDRLRREWQMERSFQTALTLFDPEVSCRFIKDRIDTVHPSKLVYNWRIDFCYCNFITIVLYLV